MYLIGYDIGSSSVKACLIDAVTGQMIASDFFPKTENAHFLPDTPVGRNKIRKCGGHNLKKAHNSVMQQAHIAGTEIKAIGISWQMHGLVLVNKQQQLIRPSIIWLRQQSRSLWRKSI